MGTENHARGLPPLRILVVDRDPLARRVVRDSLRATGLEVVAEARDGREAVALALRLAPDVVVCDLLLPELDGPTTIRRIVSSSPLVRVLVLTAVRDSEAAIGALRAGASGYVSKDLDLDSLPRIVRAVAAGEAAISRSFASVLIDRLRAAPEAHGGLRPVRSTLTPREWEVMDLLCGGYGVEEVADALVLSIETVRSHLKRAMRKLGAGSRAAAIEEVMRMRQSAAALAA